MCQYFFAFVIHSPFEGARCNLDVKYLYPSGYVLFITCIVRRIPWFAIKKYVSNLAGNKKNCNFACEFNRKYFRIIESTRLL